MKLHVCLCLLMVHGSVSAQDLAINNARIIDGTGRVIQRGSLLVSDGRIAAVLEFNQTADQVIDAAGMTVMPGMIDTHIHLITGPAPEYGCEHVIDNLDDTLAALLERGFTTVFSPGDPFPDILTLSRRIDDSVVKGPRLLTVGPAFSAQGHPGAKRPEFCNNTFEATDATTVRAQVRMLADAGVHGIKILYDSAWPPMPDDTIVLSAATEAHSMSIPMMTHVQTVEDALRALSLGVDRIVHVPHIGSLDEASLIKFSSAKMSSTMHLYAPIDRPGGVKVDHGEREYSLERLATAQKHSEEALELLRRFWDAGVPIAFGTDSYRGEPTAQNPSAHEIETLSNVLSASEIVTALTLNGAIFLDMEDEIGSLEPGKVADIVLVEGDPLTDVSALSRVALVIKGGVIVVDSR